MAISKLPKYMTFQLKRFDGNGRKRMDDVVMEDVLNVKNQQGVSMNL